MPRRSTATSAVVALVAGTAVCAFLAGESHAEAATWHTGQAYVGAKVLSVRIDGWTYGATESVPWIDSTGSRHDAGWPACLSAAAGTQRTVRFASVKVDVDGAGTRPIVLVDCRGSR